MAKSENVHSTSSPARPYILGLDLGPNSIGWAMVEMNEGEDSPSPHGLLDTTAAGHPPLGVRIFEAGLQNFDTGKEASLNQARRQARSARRTISRRRARKAAVRKALTCAGLLPTDSGELRRIMDLDPYELRAAALDRRLDAFEIGRAMIHLAQRRGFKSNRLSTDEREEKGLIAEMSKLQTEIDSTSARTLGEYLHLQSRSSGGTVPPRLRARQSCMDLYEDAPRRTRRSMYELEFDAIVQSQEKHWSPGTIASQDPSILAESLASARTALLFQHDYAISPERKAKAPSRANLHRAPGVHPCPYVSGQTGCPRSEWIAQRFRIVKDIQNIRISECYGSERSLTVEEGRFLADQLSLNKQKTFSAMGKALAREFRLEEPLEFNLERGGRSNLKGNEIEWALSRENKRKTWRALSEMRKGVLRTALSRETDPNRLAQLLQEGGLIEPEVIEGLVDFRPKDDGYMSFSRRALEKILPLMEDKGMPEHEAIQQAYPDSFTSDGLDELPSLVAMQLQESTRIKIPPRIQNQLTNLTNPIVRRALTEVRKVVNALVREHGKPTEIVIELAREMKQGKEARKEHSKRIQARSKLRESARENLKELLGIQHPSRVDVERWLLWKEQSHHCPYCDTAIGQTQVCNADTEVDHILPRWQSLDDSQNNKVLCCANCNAAKGNRHPAAWLGFGSAQHLAVLKRVRKCARNLGNKGGMSPGKIKRFEVEELDTEQFVQSQLNDTRYISKLVTSYVSLLYPTDELAGQKRVRTSRGSLTAVLRRRWGLNDILPPLVQAHGEIVKGFIDRGGWNEKVRIDHRHHAIDALVVALSTRGHLKQLQDSWRIGGQGGNRGRTFPTPWDTFHQDAFCAAEAIYVSHRPMRRRRGALHDQTFYGKGSGGDGLFITRKRLDELTPSMLDQIRDPQIAAIIKERLTALGWSPGQKKLPKDWSKGGLFILPSKKSKAPESKRVPIRRVRITCRIGSAIALGDRKHRFAKPGGNFCLEVGAVGKKGNLAFRVPTRFAANSPRTGSAPSESIHVLGQLHGKDSVLVRVAGLEDPVLAVVQNISGPAEFGSKGLDVVLRHARDARAASQGNKTPLLRIVSTRRWEGSQITKVDVDPIGRLKIGQALASPNGKV